MRISDWSSDVCSSDLGFATAGERSVLEVVSPIVQRIRRNRCGAARHRRRRAHRADATQFIPVAGLGARSCADCQGTRTAGTAVYEERKSVVSGKRVHVHVDFDGRRSNKQKKKK